MAFLANISFRRAIALVVFVVSVLVAGTAMTVIVTTNSLIDDDARTDAGDWAQFIAANIPDLKQIAAGEMPSVSSMAFLEGTRKYGQIFRYEIFNRNGYSQVVADRETVSLVGKSIFSAEAARAITEKQIVIEIAKGNADNLPPYYAQAFVPVYLDGEPIAVVAAFVDETKAHNQHFTTIAVEAVVLCLITLTAFGVPAIGWYERAREKQQADRRIRFLGTP